MIKGAIFDLDGTLLDSMSLWENLSANYLRSLGKEPQENLKEIVNPLTVEQTAQYFIEHYGVTLSAEEIVKGINTVASDFYLNKAPAKKGIGELLESLRRCGIKMCVATVTDKKLCEAALSRLGLLSYFSAVFTCSDTGYTKSEPYLYRTALEFLGTEKSETAVFEDALYALKTAKNDGFYTVAVYDVHEKHQDELKALADMYITDYSQVRF